VLTSGAVLVNKILESYLAIRLDEEETIMV